MRSGDLPDLPKTTCYSRLAKHDSSGLSHDLSHFTLFLLSHRVIGPCYKADGGVHTDDVEVVLERYWQAVQGSSRNSRPTEFFVQGLCGGDRLFKQDLSQAIGLRMVSYDSVV